MARIQLKGVGIRPPKPQKTKEERLQAWFTREIDKMGKERGGMARDCIQYMREHGRSEHDIYKMLTD